MARVRLPGWRTDAHEAEKVAKLVRDGYSVHELAIRFGRCDQWVRDQVRAVPSSSQPPAQAPASL